MIPTQEQIKEFWEWCGQYRECGYCTGSGRSYSSPDAYSQCHACNGNGYFAPRDIDLNNLFLYAVPKLKVVTLTNGYKGWTATVNQGELINGRVKAIGESKDPALALFWAIWELLKGRL